MWIKQQQLGHLDNKEVILAYINKFIFLDEVCHLFYHKLIYLILKSMIGVLAPITSKNLFWRPKGGK